MTIIEIDSLGVVREHGNLWNSPANQLQRRIGRTTTVCVGDHCGTVRDSDGVAWDWWFMADGITLEIVRAA